ncbi:MAG: ATP-grasp domain-containing protein [Bacteroidota bacterium]
MFIIDKPYVSDFLINTIKENNFQIIATPEAKKLISDESLNWVSEKNAVNFIKTNTNTPIYSNSENAIFWINNNLNFTNLPDKILFFKNKIKFRDLIKDIFPNYFYQGIYLDELDKVSVEKLKFPLIIKPAIGFFSVGVHKVEDSKEWYQALTKIKLEIKEIEGMYPNEVIDTKQFIIEEYIEGEEYAIDCYFNKDGEAIVLNILHHIFSSGKDVSDRVYSTSKEIIEKYINKIEDFLNPIGTKMDLKKFPIHIEIRIDTAGKILPIEINPLRFGGWCTTGDLSWYAYGINSYKYYVNGIKPNWKQILKSKQGKKYSIIILDNNSGIKEGDIDFFDYDKLLKDFSHPITLRKVNFNEYPVFGFLFTENNSHNENELTSILSSDLRKYIEVKN